MRLTIERQRFTRALAEAAKIAPSRPAIPILSNVLLRADGERLILAATDMEVSVRIPAQAQIEEAGAAVVPARILADFAATLDAPGVRLWSDSSALHLECGPATAAFGTRPIEDFPELPQPERSGLQIDASALASAIRKTAFAAATEQAAPVLMGVKIERTGAGLDFAAADGYRMSLLSLPGGGEPLSAVIPARALAVVQRIMTGEVWMSANDSRAVFSSDGGEVGCLLLMGNYPDVRRIVPASWATRVRVERAALLAACRRASIFARDVANTLDLTIRDEAIQVRAGADNEATTTVPAEIAGPGLELAINARYIREALDALDGQVATVELNGPTHPVGFRGADATGFIHLVMPMVLDRRRGA